jgi:hypothetical protein
MGSAKYQEPDCWVQVKKPSAEAFFRPRSAGKRPGQEEAQPSPREGVASAAPGPAAPVVDSDDPPGEAASPEPSPAKQAKRKVDEARPPPSAAKKQRPPGQRDISQFFTMKKSK